MRYSRFPFDKIAKAELNLEKIYWHYFVEGEVFLYDQLYETLEECKEAGTILNKRVILNPDKVSVKRQDPFYYLHEGNEKKLLNFGFITHIVNKRSPYEIRGTSIIIPHFKSLMSNGKIILNKCISIKSEAILASIEVEKAFETSKTRF